MAFRSEQLQSFGIGSLQRSLGGSEEEKERLSENSQEREKEERQRHCRTQGLKLWGAMPSKDV